MKKYIYFVVTSVVLFSCKKTNVASLNDFDVTISKTTYKVGDTIRFKISGNPDYVYYYAGDSANAYENRNRTSLTGKVTMSFTSRLTQGSTDPTKQQNTLQVFISNNFVTPSAGYLIDSNAVVNAGPNVWTNITNRFILPATPSNASINTGVADITDFAKASEGKPVYIAFKYADVSDPLQLQRFWYLTNITVDNTLPDGTKNNILFLINRSSNPLFSIVNIKNSDVKWTIGSSTAQTSIQGGTVAGVADNEDWLISRALNLSQVTPDKAIPIKTMSDNPVTEVSKVYTKPGTYNVVFIANNQNVYGLEQSIKEFSVTVNQ